MKNVVILGAGFAGLAAAKGLARFKDINVTLIDRHNYQLFNTNLYEVATADEEFTSQDQLKKSIGIPLSEALDKRVNYIKDQVSAISQAENFVQLGTKKIHYDYLVVALGSVSDFFGIEGAEKFSLPLKNFRDALRIKNKLEFTIQAHRSDVNKPNLRIIVAGGGYTGCEFVAELSHEIEILAWKNQYPPEKIEICIMEAASQLIPGFSSRLSQDVLWGLKNRGVRVELSSMISSVNEHYVILSDGEQEEYDVLVWTTGVRAQELPFIQEAKKDKKGRLLVNSFLRSEEYQNIFAVGDCACVLNANGKTAPPSAQDAIEHGRYLAYALPLIIRNQKPNPYKGWPHGFIVTLGGKSAVMDYPPFYFTGLLAYVFRLGANFRYYASVVGWWKALKYIVFQMGLYSRND